MKVSILTQPLGHNVGGLLQAYALQQVLKELGCEVETLDRRAPQPWLGLPRRGRLRMVARRLTGRIKALPTEQHLAAIYERLTQFRDEHIVLSPRITTERSLRDYYRQQPFDAVIVGSDQVWRPEYSPSLLNYFLDFLNDTQSQARRLAYAASFGQAHWQYDAPTTQACRGLLGQFGAVSVREHSAVSLCRDHLGVAVQWTVDPTLLLDAAHYRQLANRPLAAEPPRGGMVHYVLDPSPHKRTAIEQMGLNLGLNPLRVLPEKRWFQCRPDEVADCQYPSVAFWLRCFDRADCVVTDSYHGCLFALIFNKPFIALGNAQRGQSRFESVLHWLGLEERLVDATEVEAMTHAMTQPIDWPSVNRALSQEAQAGRHFLQDGLGLSVATGTSQ